MFFRELEVDGFIESNISQLIDTYRAIFKVREYAIGMMAISMTMPRFDASEKNIYA